ncbi:MAG: SDR family oxidoreductase [Acidimicrobiia bacterium]|nr:SDR family oxidoreductase [Acidimicrobiia bacterium]
MSRAVVITGTSTGIGRACAERMAEEGWTVYAGVRKDDDGEALKASARGDVRPVILDVTNSDHISALMARLGEELGRAGLDGLVNNAGVSEGGPIEIVSDDDWRWHFDVNVFGVVNMTRECLPLLRTARGRVVNIGSIGGRAAAPLMAPYSAGKFAIEAISESLRFEVEDFGMKVACVEPGEIKTEIWSKADEQLARVVATLDSDAKVRYERHLDMLYGFVAEGGKKGIPASKVADAVQHALTSARPKHRYLVGPDAKMAGVVSRLPDRLRHRMLSLNLNRWARAGHKLRAS